MNADRETRCAATLRERLHQALGEASINHTTDAPDYIDRLLAALDRHGVIVLVKAPPDAGISPRGNDAIGV